VVHAESQAIFGDRHRPRAADVAPAFAANWQASAEGSAGRTVLPPDEPAKRPARLEAPCHRFGTRVRPRRRQVGKLAEQGRGISGPTGSIQAHSLARGALDLPGSGHMRAYRYRLSRAVRERARRHDPIEITDRQRPGLDRSSRAHALPAALTSMPRPKAADWTIRRPSMRRQAACYDRAAGHSGHRHARARRESCQPDPRVQRSLKPRVLVCKLPAVRGLHFEIMSATTPMPTAATDNEDSPEKLQKRLGSDSPP
jgi:hypothetical protein